MIKILYIIPILFVGGTERHLFSLVKALNKKKFNPFVCCLTKEGELTEEIRKIGLEVFSLGMKNFYDFTVFFKIISLIKEKEINIVHTYAFDANFWGTLSAKIANVPVIISSRREIATWKSFRHIIAERIGNLFVDKVVACSEAVREFTIKQEKVNPQKITTIYNGINIEEYRIQNTEYREQEFSIPENEKVVGMIANFSPDKGHRYFIEAASLVCKTMNKVKFLIVGEGKSKNEIVNLSKKLNLEHKIIFAGLRKDIPQIISIMDLVVLPSLTEGFPNVILEAMAGSKPVIATDVGGVKEIVVDGKNGMLVKPKNSQLLAETIISLLPDKEKLLKIGLAGYQTIEEKFTEQKMMENYETLYEQLLERKLCAEFVE